MLQQFPKFHRSVWLFLSKSKRHSRSFTLEHCFLVRLDTSISWRRDSISNLSDRRTKLWIFVISIWNLLVNTNVFKTLPLSANHPLNEQINVFNNFTWQWNLDVSVGISKLEGKLTTPSFVTNFELLSESSSTHKTPRTSDAVKKAEAIYISKFEWVMSDFKPWSLLIFGHSPL